MDELMMIDEAPQEAEDGGYVEAVVEETAMDAENRLEKINGWEAYRQKWLAHYQKCIDEVNERADRNIAWHKFHLSRFFRSVPHKATETTFYYDGLPSCRLVMNKATDKINKPDKQSLEKILLRLAEAGEKDMIKRTVTDEVDWSKYKDNLKIVDGQVVDKRTGEFLDDVPITHCEEEFVLKFKKEKKETNENEDHGNSNT